MLAQALEVYHAHSPLFDTFETSKETHEKRLKGILENVKSGKDRNWLEYKLKFSNQKALSHRIDEVLSLYSTESAQLMAGIESFSEKVRDSRNYYTHYSDGIRARGNVAGGLRNYGYE